MFVCPPSLRRAAYAALACCALLTVQACSHDLSVDSAEGDSGPCGRGKARSCACDDGRRGIAQCLVGGEWGACWCADADSSTEGAPGVDAGAGDGKTVSSIERPETSLACDEPFDLRAHAASGAADPYLVHGSGVLGSGGEHSVCFYFRAPYPSGSQALAFVPLADEVSRPDYWLLYGIDQALHADGEVVPCGTAEAGAYLLAGFSPGSSPIILPDGVGLALPSAASSGLILELHYGDSLAVELLDRTGVRICAASAGTREHEAAVHFTGSEAICIPPGASDFEVSAVCHPQTDRGRIHILSVWPRMLQHGKRMTVVVHRTDGSSESLFDQTVSSPLQQRTLAGEVTLEPGDTLQTSCFFDNQGLLSAPFGSDGADALCYAFIGAWPAGALSANEGPPTPFSLDFSAPATESAGRCLAAAAPFSPCL
ncbi:MAG: hypothetical protein JWN04_1221 [Myxococcaceae bacterium]|nr:hypothetical protein [Myxococcaceae bacterium]